MNDTAGVPAAPSPFVGDVQWAWDSTSLGWFKECPRKYFLHMREGWKGRGEAVHLEFGILYHKALEVYDRLRFSEGIFYRDGSGRFETPVDHDRAVKFVVYQTMLDTWRDGKPWRASADLPVDDKASLKSRENLVRSIVWYLDRFRNDPAQTKIGPDGPMVELHFQFDLDYGPGDRPYALCGYLDRVVTFQGQDFVMDRKTTTSTVGSYYFDQFDPDNQISLYTVAAQVAFHTPVKGVIIDAMQIAVGFSRPVRSFVFKTQDQVDEWMTDLEYWLRQAEWCATAGRWPMNDKSCHKYGGCPFRAICQKSPGVRDKFLESNFERRPWNPLELR